MSRLVRVRHRDDLPEGYRAFAWMAPNGNVIVYVSKRLNALQRNIAARKALRAVGVPRRRLALVPLVGLLPWSGRHRARHAASLLAAAAIAVGVIVVFGSNGGDSFRAPSAQGPPIRTGPPTPRRAHVPIGKAMRSGPHAPSPVGYAVTSGRREGSGSGVSPRHPAPVPIPRGSETTGPATPAPTVTPSTVPSPSPTRTKPSATPSPAPTRPGSRCVLRLVLGQWVRVCL